MQKNYAGRRNDIFFIFGVVGFVFIARLFYVQLVDDRYELSALNNSRRLVTVYPARGLIYDRNGKLMVYNEAAYDLMVIPNLVTNMDTMEFCSLLSIDTATFRKNLQRARAYSRYKESIFEKQISKEAYAYLQEKLFKYPGFYVQTRTLRKYPEAIAAHTFGYVGEVDENDTKRDAYYRAGDYIGISGLEKSYEELLRGRKGVKFMVVDVFNRIKGSYREGVYDTASVMGDNLYTSLDMDLQRYGESLMQNKKGSVVAIDPSTGGILAIVSAPTYDPNLLVGRVRSKNVKLLQQDTLKPLFNRAAMAKYPPGSTFKLINGLIGLQEKIITVGSRFPCKHGYHAGGLKVGCHAHQSPLDFIESVQHSCNAYYCNVFRMILDKTGDRYAGRGYQQWRNHVVSFGFGERFDDDIPFEKSGFIPKVEYYDRYYGKNRWKSLTVVSLAIGQGEILTTPLQLANQAAIIANRGWYYVPHLVDKVGKSGKSADVPLKEKIHTTIEAKYFEPLIEGMYRVVEQGTGTRARIDSITVCAKTGTAQNPHGKDHSIFIAFAPKDNPKIAIAVIVENAGFGSTWAAPIASLMIEQYLAGRTTRKRLEDFILNGDLLR